VNMKKLFPNKGITKKGLFQLFNKKGFYIVLMLCIAIAGTAAVIVSMYDISFPAKLGSQKVIPDEFDNLAGKARQSVESSMSTALSSTVPPKKDDAKLNDNKAVQENKDKPKTVSEPAPNNNPGTDKKPQKTVSSKPIIPKDFIAPVMGHITLDYAMDTLVYSKTMEEWRVHQGVDISSDRGTPVKAAADGVVAEVRKDPGYGVTIVLEHQNGLKTVYANLASDNMVSPNQLIEQGDVIGCVGNTAPFEQSEESHLHFEVKKNDKPIDPKGYLPKNE